MSSIDTRVVEAKFDNSQFQQGVQGTVNSLNQLKSGLNGLDGTKALDGLGDSAGKVKAKIDVMRIATLVAISTIAHQAVRAGENLVKSLTIDPVAAGLQSYNDQINATQIILANTKAQGTTLKDVTKTLAELQQYANLTVYSFSDMTTNIGRFTAAGVPLKQATVAIKGMANTAALSGASTMQMTSAMYQMSQALSVGVIKLQDWNSLSNANMAGQNIQDALKATARTMDDHGKKMDAAIKKQGSFRQSLTEGWLTSDIYTKAMGVMAGTIDKATGKMKAFSVEQLKQQGYSEKDAKALHELSQQALNSAIQIRTMPQMMQALKEEVATAYGAVFKTIFGDINQATSTFTALHNSIENALTGPIYAFNRVLQGWSKLGGRTALIDGLVSGFHDIMAIINPIKQAFREIFPATTANTLYKLTVAFRDLMGHLKIGATTANELKRTFAGLFAVVDILWQAVKAGINFLGGLLGAVGKTSGGILQFTAHIGDWLVKLDKAIKNGHAFTQVFDALGKVLTPIITVLGYTRIAFFDLMNAISTGFNVASGVLPKIAHVLGMVTSKLHDMFTNMFKGVNFQNVINLVNAGLFGGLILMVRKFIKRLTTLGQGPSPAQSFIDKITEPFTKLTDTLKQMQQTLQVTTLLEIAAAVGILTASVFTLSKIDPAALAQSLGALGTMFAELMGSLWLFQKVGGAKGLFVTSAGLILFATAIRVLTSSVKSLADLSWKDLAQGLTGVAGLLAALVLVSKGMEGNAGGMIRTGAGLTILAVGIKILASALTDISNLSWQQMAKGLVGVGALLGSLAIFSRLVEAGKAGVLQGAGLVLLAGGIKILASAVADFSKLNWENMAKGILGVAGVLGAIALFSRTVGNPATMIASGAALVAIGAGMKILASAIKDMGGMDWENIAKGLVTMGGALAIISIALGSMDGVLGGAAALLIVSGALVVLGQALQSMGGMDWENIAKSLVVLGGSLAIIALGMAAMTEALPGAAALLVVSGALAVFVPELAILGSMSWDNIAKGLVALAGAFTVIGVAGALLTPVIPSLLGLGASIALLGVGVAAIGAGILAFGIGLGALSGGIVTFAASIGSLLALVPTLATQIGAALVAVAHAIGTAGPSIMEALSAVLFALVGAIQKNAPRIIDTFASLLVQIARKMADTVPRVTGYGLQMMLGFLKVCADNAPRIVNQWTNLIVNILNSMTANMPRFVNAGVRLVVSFLNGVAAKMGDIIAAGTNIIIAFIRGVGSNAVRIANAAMQTIVQFVNGLATAIEVNVGPLRDAGGRLAFAIADGMTLGLASKVKDVASAAKDMAKGALDGAKHFLGIHSPSKEFIKIGQYVNEGFVKGIVGSKDTVNAAWGQVHDVLKAAVQSSSDDIKRYSDRLATLESAHKKNTRAIAETAAALSQARKEHVASIDALDKLNKSHDTALVKLRTLGAQYDTLKTKIDNANQSLVNAKQVRDDYNKQVTDNISALPDITDQTTLTDFQNTLQYQVNDATKFADVLGQLRTLGLNDTIYKQLVDKGPASLQLAEQLLEAGQNGIQALDQLSDQLGAEAAKLGSTASTQLYQAGVNAAQGIVNGLNSQLKTVENQMTKIAQAMVKALKKELKIKSPSQIFAELGEFSTKGLAKGLTGAIPHVTAASTQVAKSAVSTMRDALSGIDAGVDTNMQLTPTIAPVLDLSAVKKDAGQLDTVLANKSIAIDSTYSTAKDASAGYQANVTAQQAPADIAPASTTEVNFTQINNSPKALSSAEIYRQTNNQLSRVRGALTSNAA